MTPEAATDMFSAIVSAPFGAIGIRTEAEQVRELVYLPPHFGEQAATDAVAELAALQVARYLADADFAFSLPLRTAGTAFQQRVWQALRAIPCGETASYQQVAQAIGQPNAVRAVAGACAANRLAIVIPCHRVVRNDGALSGYRWGTARKALLLKREAKRQEG